MPQPVVRSAGSVARSSRAVSIASPRDAGRQQHVDELAHPLGTPRRLDAERAQLRRRVAAHDGPTEQALGARSQLDATRVQILAVAHAGRHARRVERRARVDELLLRGRAPLGLIRRRPRS